MRRRDFLRMGVGTIAGASCIAASAQSAERPIELAAPCVADGPPLRDCTFPRGPIRSVIPVVGDSKWVWTSPPKGQTGYLEPRRFEVKFGIELTGQGSAGQIMASTPVPVQLPEQKIDRYDVKSHGCVAKLRVLAPEAGQLILSAPSIVKGQTISAVAQFSMTLSKQYQATRRNDSQPIRSCRGPSATVIGQIAPAFRLALARSANWRRR